MGTINKNNTYTIHATLDGNDVNLEQTQIKHSKTTKNIIRAVPIKNRDNNGFYFLSEQLKPNSIKYSTKKYNNTNYDTTYLFFNKHINKEIIENNKEIIEDKKEVEENKEIDNLIDNLNNFKQTIINKIKYIMKIPKLENSQYSYNCIVDSTYVKNEKMFKNILEYQKMVTDLSIGDINLILKYCSCKYLFHILSMDITDNNIKLSIKIDKIYPETLDVLNDIDSLRITDQLNKYSLVNMIKYNDLNIIVTNKIQNKKDVAEELRGLLL